MMNYLLVVSLFFITGPLYINLVSGQCTSSDTNGFTDVLSTNGAVTVPRDRNYLYLFFSVNFTCSLEISSFTILAELLFSGQSRSYPLIQIWRQVSSPDIQYNRIHSVGANNEVTSINFTHYLYTPANGPLSVMEGDILGVLVPSDSNAITLPYFIDDISSPAYYETTVTGLNQPLVVVGNSQLFNQYLPLVSIEIMPSDSDSTSVFPSTIVVSSTSPVITTSDPGVSSTNTMGTTTVTTDSGTPDTTTIIPSDTSSFISVSSSINTPITMTTSTQSTDIVLTTLPTATPSERLTSSPSLPPPMSSPSPSLPPPPMSSFSPLTSPSLTSPSSSPTDDDDPSSPISAAAIGGLTVAIILLVIIIGLVFVLVLLFGLGKKKRGKKGSYSPPKQVDIVDQEPLDNPNYSAVGNYMPPSVTSTLTGDRFVTHYEIPGYQDPLGSPVDQENHYDEATTNGVGITAFYDEARREGIGGTIYNELAEDHYEMNDQRNHYEMNDEFIYESPNGPPSGYERPVSSRSNTLKGATHYDVVPDDLKSDSSPLHKYSVLTTKDIFVPTEEERLEMSHPQQSFDSERLYSQLEVRQRQRYENINFFEETDIYWRPATERTVLYDQLARRKYREIRQSQLRITKHLGSGQFGTVNEGVWQSPNGLVGVAIKMLAENSDEEQKVKLLQEAAIMGQFSHPNVVKLHGVVTVGEPVMIVMDLMKNGDLRNHLLSVRSNLDQQSSSDESLPLKLLKFCQQIVNGMNYLSRKSFVHRDLAARNVFLDDDFVCKIGDFGMSRDLEDDTYYISHGGQIPIKWTAPEALQYKRYSTASDVWSYGALMYEIWSLGHKPFEGFSNPQAVDMVQTGYRLPPPPGCPRGIYQMMIHCWHPDSSRRPTFKDILGTLSDGSPLLLWRDVDRSVHAQGSQLGAALEAGQELYPELQQTFIKYTIKMK